MAPRQEMDVPIGDEFADWKWMGLQEKGVLT